VPPEAPPPASIQRRSDHNISSSRAFVLGATLTGSGKSVDGFRRDTTTNCASSGDCAALLINSSNSSYTGNWVINSGWIEGAGLNSMGFGNVTLTSSQGASTLDVDYDWSKSDGLHSRSLARPAS